MLAGYFFLVTSGVRFPVEFYSRVSHDVFKAVGGRGSQE